MKIFVMLAGVPCSGKSTFRDGVVTDDYVVLSTDDYIERIAISDGITYNDAFRDHIKAAERNMYADLAHAIAEGKNILWDQTNLTTQGRMKKLSTITSNYNKRLIVFDTDVDLALSRNHARNGATGKFVPEHIIRNMATTLEYPTREEGWDNVTIIKTKK